MVSQWQPGPAGPARRTYAITPLGLQRLHQWTALLERRGQAMLDLAAACRELLERMDLPEASSPTEEERE